MTLPVIPVGVRPQLGAVLPPPVATGEVVLGAVRAPELVRAEIGGRR